MICEHCRHHIDAFVREETTPALSTEITAHLSGCAECRAESEAARALALALRSLHRPAPAGLAERIIAAAPPSRRATWFSPLRAVAAVLLVSVAFMLTSEGRRIFSEETFQAVTGSPADRLPVKGLPSEPSPLLERPLESAPSTDATAAAEGTAPLPAASPDDDDEAPTPRPREAGAAGRTAPPAPASSGAAPADGAAPRSVASPPSPPAAASFAASSAPAPAVPAAPAAEKSLDPPGGGATYEDADRSVVVPAARRSRSFDALSVREESRIAPAAAGRANVSDTPVQPVARPDSPARSNPEVQP